MKLKHSRKARAKPQRKHHSVGPVGKMNAPVGFVHRKTRRSRRRHR